MCPVVGLGPIVGSSALLMGQPLLLWAVLAALVAWNQT